MSYYLKTTYIMILVAILLPLCFFGFDFTDFGYHLTNQLQANSLGLKQLLFNPIWGGSDLVGGVWIKWFGEELWIIRLFPTLIYGTYFWILSQGIVSAYTLPLMILTLYSASPMPSGMIYLADYYTLPMLGVSCWTLLWHRLNNEKIYSYLTIILLALTSYITTLLRLPMMALLAFPLFFFVLERNKKKALSWIILGLTGLLIFYFSGIIENIILGMKQQSLFLAKSSGLDSFVNAFFRHLKENLIFFAEIMAITYIIHRIAKKTFSECALYVYALIIGFAILDTTSIFDNIGVFRGLTHSCFKRGLNSFHLLLIFAIVRGIWKDRTKLYLLPIAIMPFILNFGTNTGISKINYLLPCTFFCLVQIQNISLPKRMLYVFLLLSVPWNYKNFYRDGKFTEMVSLENKVAKLNHLQTSIKTKNKIEWINTLLLEKNLKGKTIFTYPALPNINYLNDSPLYMGYPWSHFIKESLLYRELSSDCQSGKLKIAFIATDFKDSPRLIEHLMKTCPIKDEGKFANLQFISF